MNVLMSFIPDTFHDQARIMAAQEKAKQGAAPPPPSTAPPADLLDSFDTPAESQSAPPPPFDVSLLPPQSIAPPSAPPPPAFEDALLPPATTTAKPPPITTQPTATWNPNLETSAAAPPLGPPAASAPVFEDLLDPMAEETKPPAYHMTPVAPPTVANPTTGESGGLDQDAIDAILGIEGLSDEEKAALIAEQEKIMASIEQEKRNKGPAGTASARADAFEQRSHAAAVNAIGGGSTTTTTTTTVAAVAATTADEQLAADMELAQQLQEEEYKKADEQQQRAARARAKAVKSSSSSPSNTTNAALQESSWMDWLGFGATPPPATGRSPTTTGPPASPDRSFAQKPLERGEIGVSLPPGASKNNSALAMAAAYTGQEDDVDVDAAVRYSPSRDGADDEDAALMGGGARVAKQQPLFSCVADSISSAANSLYNTVADDGEGNVHGVDTSGLLAMSQAGRGDASSGDYQNIGNGSGGA